MTTACTIQNPASANSLKLVTWAPLTTASPDGAPFEFADWADRAVQVFGTFGSGGSLVVQGSNDFTNPTNWVTINGTTGSALSFTAAGLLQMNEAPLWIRPLLVGGDGTSSITVAVLARRLVQTSQ